jgi:Lon protease-like protein
VPQLLPIFPLDSVLLPGAPLPLHIFEPRYRELVADVWLEHGRDNERGGFGIVAFAHPGIGGEVRGPGRQHRAPEPEPAEYFESDSDYDIGEAPANLAGVGTFASIIEVEAHEDGRSNLLTIGRRRFRLLELEPTGKPYLRAQVDWLPEDHGPVSDALAEAARSRCARYLRELAQLAGRELPDVTFADDPMALSYQLAGRMRLPNNERQGLLEAATAAERLRTTLRLLRREIVLMTQTRSVPVSPGLLQSEAWPN